MNLSEDVVFHTSPGVRSCHASHLVSIIYKWASEIQSRFQVVAYSLSKLFSLSGKVVKFSNPKPEKTRFECGIVRGRSHSPRAFFSMFMDSSPSDSLSPLDDGVDGVAGVSTKEGPRALGVGGRRTTGVLGVGG
jgi:hypothetical protein